ncbi:MAG TPA: hypothetical protein VF286_01975 [Acidiphilium sp.]
MAATTDLPPAVIVHDRSHIARVLAPGLPVTLLSPPGFALYAGCLWWKTLLDQTGFAGPALLDCADAPGRALAALRLGISGIVLAAEPEILARVSAIAASTGALVLAEPPPALDLATRDADRHLASWLGHAGEFG